MAQIQVQHQSPVAGPNGVAAGGVSGAGGANQFVTTSLYVGDLEAEVTDSQIYDLFNQIGQVVSVRVCRDLSTRRSLGYGYVNYSNPQDAARALEVLNFTPLNGKSIRVMYSHRDPSNRKSGNANIFIKNLDKAIDNKSLHDTFSTFGNILSCKIATDSTGQSKGYGFVQFENEESAQNAIDQLNGMLMNDKQVYVGRFLRRQERETTMSHIKFNNVYVKNLAESTTEEDLKKIFGEFGTITSAVVMRDGGGNSKGFGFVNFANADDAANAVEALNGRKFDDKEWYVGKAQKKSEREQELKSRFEQTVKETVDKFQGANLYIKNLDDSVDDDKLKELFAEFGTITSCKVMRDPTGSSRGSGFVAFSTPEEAAKALALMNGKMVVSKPLYVAIAQRKEERRARLQIMMFRDKEHSFGTVLAQRAVTRTNPAEWWIHFGASAPELQEIAVKVLSQTTSSSNCERNWSTFSLIHTKTRNRLKYQKLNKLVYVAYNMRLKIRHATRLSQSEIEDSFNPINLDYIFEEDDPLSPWLQEREEPLLDDQDNSRWLDVSDDEVATSSSQAPRRWQSDSPSGDGSDTDSGRGLSPPSGESSGDDGGGGGGGDTRQSPYHGELGMAGFADNVERGDISEPRRHSVSSAIGSSRRRPNPQSSNSEEYDDMENRFGMLGVGGYGYGYQGDNYHQWRQPQPYPYPYYPSSEYVSAPHYVGMGPLGCPQPPTTGYSYPPPPSYQYGVPPPHQESSSSTFGHCEERAESSGTGGSGPSNTIYDHCTFNYFGGYGAAQQNQSGDHADADYEEPARNSFWY